ncbi:MAG: peptide MFS transporter [Ignavibacteria bacterium]|jgi:POT family proton-dependent oligopeptide transporter|nr:peptide MFS transporter [Ignavibacteria bacterium]
MSLLSGHPKGLYVAFFANMGERFGFYTMMAILVLFLQAKFGLTEDGAGEVYSYFYFAIYILALVGGFIADSLRNFRKTIAIGIAVMTIGYVLMAVPGLTLPFVIAGLLIIAFGNGLFKGNIQALVGKLYDKPEFEHLRDSAFSIFYMGINVGAFFAPFAAVGIRDWFLESQGFGYDKELPGLCHKFLDGLLPNSGTLQTLADKVSGASVGDLTVFANQYIEAFGTGYNLAFAIAAAAMVVSMVIFLVFQKHMAYADKYNVAEKGKVSFKGFTKNEKQRIKALLLVFIVVIFFWMSFHQNGLTLMYFARDYVAKNASPFTNIFFNLKSLLTFIAAIFGVVLLIKKGSKGLTRLIGAGMFLVGGGLTYYLTTTFDPAGTPIAPELFEAFNPVLIVFLTPVVLAFFAYLNKRNAEPSTPRKIGIGMIITAVAFGVMLVGSISLVAPKGLLTASEQGVSPYLLIGTYFLLTIAELFLSPMGLSFVSKVAPDRLKGLMQGGWLGATAVGNKLLFIGSSLWSWIDELWYLWAFFAICCLISAIIIFSKMKFLEEVTKE